MSGKSPILVNSNGLFNGVHWAMLMSQISLDQMKKNLEMQEEKIKGQAKVKPLEKKLRKDQRRVLELLDTLPRKKFGDGGRNYYITSAINFVRAGDKEDMMIVVPNLVGNFVTALKDDLTSDEQWHENPEDWGFEAVREITKHQKALLKLGEEAWREWGNDRPENHLYRLYEENGEVIPAAEPGMYYYKREPRYTFPIPDPEMICVKSLRAAKRLADMFAKGEVSLRSENVVENLSKACAFAVYAKASGGEGGYLDGRGNFVDSLGGARLFESAKAAETTIRSRQLKASVVSVDVEVTGMAPGHTASDFEKLGEVISDLNRRKLMDLVSKVRGEDIAELRDKLSIREAELDGQAGKDKPQKMPGGRNLPAM